MKKMYYVKCVSGNVKHVVWSGTDWDEAVDFCEYNLWVYDWNGGLWWDLIIEEE